MIQFSPWYLLAGYDRGRYGDPHTSSLCYALELADAAGGLSKICMDHLLWNMDSSKSLKLPMIQFGIILRLLLVNRYFKKIKIISYFD